MFVVRVASIHALLATVVKFLTEKEPRIGVYKSCTEICTGDWCVLTWSI